MPNSLFTGFLGVRRDFLEFLGIFLKVYKIIFVFHISEDGSEIKLKHCASSKTSVKSSRKYLVYKIMLRKHKHVPGGNEKSMLKEQ